MARLLANRGLVTSSSELTRTEGALSIADNICVDFDNTVQQRRGFKEYSQLLAQSPKQLLTYKNKLLVHYDTLLAFDSTNTGTFVNFSGDFEELVPGLRIKGLETSGNFYFTTNEGIKKISSKTEADIATTAIVNAGAVKAIDLTGKIVPDAAGFLPAQSKVAYRLVFGYKDASSNLLLGSPSARLVLTNQSDDVNQSEIFTANVTGYATIVDGDYFIFDTADSGYYVWFKKTGAGVAPINADTLDREGIEVDIQTASSDIQVAANIANALSSTVTQIGVELSGTEVEITITNPGDVADAGQGSLLTTEVLITKVFDGSISEGSPAKAELTFTVPPEINENYFYHIYRTAYVSVTAGVTLADIDPGDEQYFVLETPITAADILAGTITLEENTPDSFRAVGAPSYTNAITGTGITQANERPPIAQDMALFRNSTFYANTKDIHRSTFSILSVDDFVSGSTKFYIYKNGVESTYTFTGVPQVVDITPIERNLTVGNSYITLNSAENEREYYAWFDKGVISHTFDSSTNVDDGVLNFIEIVGGHGMATGDKVTFTGITPPGISTGVTYYIVRKTSTHFAVSLTPGGAEVDITGYAVGNGTVTHLPEDPALTGKTGIRVPLEIYDDTVQGSKDALLDSLLSFPDFSAVDYSGTEVRVSNADSGAATAPTASSPASGWTFAVITAGTGEDIATNKVLLSQNASVGLAIDLTARSLVRVINRDSTSPVVAQYLSGSDDLPGKILLEAKALEDVDFYIAISSSLLSAEFSPELPSWDEVATFPITVVSDNNESPNRIYFSKVSQPEAVPLPNYIDVGSKDKPILRILALRDNLFVLKTDGIYIVTGSSAPNFSVRLLDNSAICTAPDTADVLNNLIYCLTTQGVVSISDSGVSIVSRPIEDQIKKVTTFAYDFTYTSFGVGYESDRSYVIWLPSVKTDDIATQAFRYNTITNTWTRWTKSNTCGLVNDGDDRMYLGKGDRDYVEQERKNGERQDYADRDFVRSISSDSVNDTEITLNSATDVEVGDAFTQEQYLTIVKFNRFLKKLDNDNGPADNDYYSTLVTVPGVDMANSLTALVVKLNADANLAGTFTTPSGLNTLLGLKTDYNTLIAELNDPSSGTIFKDYLQLTDLLTFELNITAITLGTNRVTVDRNVNLIVGDVTVYKAIKTKVQWSTQHFGTPEKLKQIKEGTLIFDQGTIRNGIVSYSTDRSANFEDIAFTMDGSGFWDGFGFGDGVFGGFSNDAPVRTLIPQDKSRCRYINVMFQHFNAREQYKLIGISLEPREVSVRGYR